MSHTNTSAHQPLDLSTEEEPEMASSTSVIDNLSPIDALWAFLALGAAWSVGSGRSED